MVAVAVALVPDAISGQTALLISLTSICPGLKPKWLTACALNPFEKSTLLQQLRLTSPKVEYSKTSF